MMSSIITGEVLVGRREIMSFPYGTLGCSHDNPKFLRMPGMERADLPT